MGRAVALIVWAWIVALYLVAYYVALATWGTNELYALLGETAYNRLIPLGGWRAVVVPSIVFLAVLALVSLSHRALAAIAEWLHRRASVPRTAGLVVAHILLVALAGPATHAGVVTVRDSITRAVDRARFEEAAARGAEESARSFALNPFLTGEGMGPIVTAYAANFGFVSEHLLLDSDGLYRRTTWGCAPYFDGRSEGRYEREGDVIVLQPPTFWPEPGVNWPCDSDGAPLARRLHDVRWGGRRYLVPDHQLELFCRLINDGGETAERSRGWILLRVGDETLLATGRPSLPAPWDDSLLPAPLEGRTLTPGAAGGLWVDLGADHGLRAGMQLFLANALLRAEFHARWGGRSEIPQTFDVVEVEPGRSRIDFEQPGRARLLLPIPVGSTVTSLRPPGG